jgi:hypothetical protein
MEMIDKLCAVDTEILPATPFRIIKDMAVDTVLGEPVSLPNSLLSGINTGIF